MPILQDNSPPVSVETLHRARVELPREYGLRIVDERGHRALLVRVPRAKPDYNYELADVALYASLADVKDVKDVVMIGDEKSVRMEPVRLRDHIRDQIQEDVEIAAKARTTLPRAHDSWSVVTSPGNHNHKALVIRVPVERLADATTEHFRHALAAIGSALVDTLRETQYVYFVTDTDHGRVGRRIFIENLAPDVAHRVTPAGSDSANPLHLRHQTPGGHLRPSE